jgi:hypothetical protein
MSAIAGSKILISVPSTTLQQMCNYVAIAETKSPAESLRELILHTLYEFEEEKISNVQDISQILQTIFGVHAPDHQIQESLDHLTTTGQVTQPIGTNYILPPDSRDKIKTRIENASKLQERVKMQWLVEMIGRAYDLNAENAWSALQDYLAKAFLRHGIQVAVFLDPSVRLQTEYATSLSTLLDKAVQAKFDVGHQELAKRVISDFLASAGQNQDRAQYIADCADGAANYFSLAISPELSAKFRENLNPLTLFCDTNFIFGILGLHVHPLVDVSNQLMEAILKYKLPIKLRYHEATLREIRSSITHYGNILRKQTWPRSLSRAVIISRCVSGIELKYHFKNAEVGIDVDSFLRPYQHVDVLLKGKEIDIYKPIADRLEERATLQSAYENFLTRNNKDKPSELIDHDATVLDCAKSLRNNGKSTLDAGALFVTCDFTLYRFDNEESRRRSTQTSVVLPNILWQILRPFIPANQDFDRTFAETFAIPEFRSIGSGAAKACSKMLCLLAAYQDFSEETAVKLLSNDVLIDHLRTAQNDEQFQTQVESAIAEENLVLLEERTAMAKQVEKLKSEKDRTEEELERQKQLVKAEAEKAQKAITEREKATELMAIAEKDKETSAQQISSKLSEIEAAKISAENAANDAENLRQTSENRELKTAKRASIIVAVLLTFLFELIIHYVWQWDWLLNHPNSYGLQASICLLILFGIPGAWVKSWRKFCWGVAILGALFVIFPMLGGPVKK